jgi:hypothetical protein
MPDGNSFSELDNWVFHAPDQLLIMLVKIGGYLQHFFPKYGEHHMHLHRRN